MLGNIMRGQEIVSALKWRLYSCRTITTFINVAKKITPATSGHYFHGNIIITSDVINQVCA
jgi:hypothetical protein